MELQVGDTIAEANENVMLELKSRVVFLENFIKKYKVCILLCFIERITSMQSSFGNEFLKCVFLKRN